MKKKRKKFCKCKNKEFNPLSNSNNAVKEREIKGRILNGIFFLNQIKI